MAQTCPLDLPEIRSIIATNLDLQALTSCVRISQDWKNSFTPQLYKSVVMSKHGPSMETFERNTRHIKSLKVRSYFIREQALTYALNTIVSSIITNSTLTTLALRMNEIGPNGAQALAETLKTNSTLTTLDLSYNQIGDYGDYGAQALAEALKTNSTLTTLNCSGNFIGDYGAQALAEALKANSTLTTLSCGSNQIGDYRDRALAEAIRPRPS